VKTSKGKAISRLNALKHGILSREAIIRRGDAAESAEEYRELQGIFLRELKPVGLIEHMLVGKLLIAFWRWRRAIRIESAHMEAATTDFIEREGNREKILSSFVPSQYNFDPKKDRWDAALKSVTALAEHIDKSGFPLPEIWEETMTWMIAQKNEALTEAVQPLLMAQHLYKMQKTTLTADNAMMPILRKRAWDAVEVVKRLRQELLERDEHRYRASAQAAQFDGTVERLQRYETTLHRQFMHLLHELERQQARRLGYHVPIATTIDVILAKQNWVRLEKEAPRSLSVPSQDALGIGKMALDRANLALKQ
jgi:dsDNA-binding SOS-regulon protein